MKNDNQFAAPSTLSGTSQRLWQSLVPRRAKSPERLALLQQALEELDRAAEARAIISKEGSTVTSSKTGTVRVHPAVQIERAARSSFVKAWKLLGLSWDMEIDGEFKL